METCNICANQAPKYALAFYICLGPGHYNDAHLSYEIAAKQGFTMFII